MTDPWAVMSFYYGLFESDSYGQAWNLQSPSHQGSEGSYPFWMDGYVNTGSQILSEIPESGHTVYVNLSAVDTATGTQYFHRLVHCRQWPDRFGLHDSDWLTY